MDTPHGFYLTAEQAELLERYVADGPGALEDPRVATFVAEHAALLAEIDSAFVTLRGALHRPMAGPPRAGVVAPDIRLRSSSVDRPGARQGPAFSFQRVVAGRTPIVGRIGLGFATVAAIALITIVSRRQPPSPLPAVSHYATSTGQTATVTLIDGSHVKLAPRTTLRVLDARSLVLDGEASFDVVPNVRVPLTIRTGAIVTRVLGTRFDIRRYADESEGQIVVRTGKIGVQGAGGGLILSAGMSVILRDSLVATPRVDDADAFVGWTDGQLAFRNAPVAVVLATLRRWYGYEFQTTDSTLRSGYVTTVIPIGEPDEMLRRLERVLSASVTRRDSVITLRPNPHHHMPRTAERRTLPPFSEVGR